MSSIVPSDGFPITDSECESIASKESVDVGNFNELSYLRHQNKRQKEELNIYKQKIKNLETENQELRISKCAMQAKVEVEEEFITNSLLRQISSLKKNAESLKSKFEREEECLVQDLTGKLKKLETEKARLEELLESSRGEGSGKLDKKVKKLQEETRAQQKHLEQLRQDKGDIQNALEQEQEALFNRLWRNISQADRDRVLISEKIDVHCGAVSGPKSYASSKSQSNPKKCYSLQPKDLRRMSMGELTDYVLSLQRELTAIQNRSSSLDPDKYQKLLSECNIDERHWIKQKIATSSCSSRGRSPSLTGHTSSETSTEVLKSHKKK